MLWITCLQQLQWGCSTDVTLNLPCAARLAYSMHRKLPPALLMPRAGCGLVRPQDRQYGLT